MAAVGGYDRITKRGIKSVLVLAPKCVIVFRISYARVLSERVLSGACAFEDESLPTTPRPEGESTL